VAHGRRAEHSSIFMELPRAIKPRECFEKIRGPQSGESAGLTGRVEDWRRAP
jgi:hypothetical protein